MGIYQGYFKPLKGMRNNHIELFNEIIISFSSFYIVAFSNIHISEPTKY